MKRNSMILALIIGLTFVSLACSKSGTATNMSQDDKHKLVAAAEQTDNIALIKEVYQKIGLVDSGGAPTPALESFYKDYRDWKMKNPEFANKMSNAEAEAYVKSHMP